VYPGLTLPLAALLGVFAVATLALLIRYPVSRRLALRQVARRRTEALLVISGSLLGTAIIVGALVVGDTLGSSVRQVAYNTLGPIDERVTMPSTGDSATLAAHLSRRLSRDSHVDGVLTARVIQAAATTTGPRAGLAEPRVYVWDLSFAEASRFGGASGSGLSGPEPGSNQVVINTVLAEDLGLHAGDTVRLYIAGTPRELVVQRVVPARGVAGTGFGATVNRDVFVHPGLLPSGPATRLVTWVSNAGGVEAGRADSARVASTITRALSGNAVGATVEQSKKTVLDAADKTGDTLGALFLMIGSFSIIAGALLLVNIFVMLADERKSQLGMLRAAGLKRSQLVAAFAFEGSIYAALSTVVGAGVGIGIGRGVSLLAARIFNTWSADGSGLDITFGFTMRSLVNGAALGLTIALLTILATSIRISRFNIVAAIRDIDVAASERSQRRTRVVATSLSVLFAVAAVPAVRASQGVGTFLLPSLSALCAVPLMRRRLSKRTAYSVAATFVLAWSLLANLIRPGIYDTPSMAVYVVLGTLLAFSSVTLLSENQEVVLRPLRRVLGRSSERAVAIRIALAYPLAKRFRTGATLIMYTLIMLVLVLLTEIGGVLNRSIDNQVASSTAGYAMRLDFNPDEASGPLTIQRDPRMRAGVTKVVPLTSAVARATDPGRRTSAPLQALIVGVPTMATRTMEFEDRLPGLTTDAEVWRALADHADYVVVDPFFGATGGPAGQFYEPGDRFRLTDPSTGVSETKVIAGVLRNATMFYSPTSPAAFPAITSVGAVRHEFGRAARVSSALVAVAPGVAARRFALHLQSQYLPASLVATPLASTIRRLFAANLAFFRLMEGFLALGLLVGIAGLGVVMVRAVRERRRTIGVLRALGFRARTVERCFLIESAFVALEGVVVGAVLGVVTTWLMYQKSAAFSGIKTGYPIMWESALVLVVTTVIASLLATLGPARRAARVLPALATRVSD
jgi:putative ABC transport system permease protein